MIWICNVGDSHSQCQIIDLLSEPNGRRIGYVFRWLTDNFSAYVIVTGEEFNDVRLQGTFPELATAQSAVMNHKDLGR